MATCTTLMIRSAKKTMLCSVEVQRNMFAAAPEHGSPLPCQWRYLQQQQGIEVTTTRGIMRASLACLQRHHLNVDSQGKVGHTRCHNGHNSSATFSQHLVSCMRQRPEEHVLSCPKDCQHRHVLNYRLVCQRYLTCCSEAPRA